jgi:hypothetical protein
MHRVLVMTAATFTFFTAIPRAQAQARNDLMLHAILGGVGGVLGALTREAIDDVAQRPAYNVSRYRGVSTSPVYEDSFPSEDRSGVHYNKPCSTFDAVTGRLLPCQVTAAYGASAYIPGQETEARPTQRQRHVVARDEPAERSSPRVARASAGEADIRQMIAATVASNPRFGGWSIIGAPRFVDARLSPQRRFGGAFGGNAEEYCVSATMIVAGIPQPKSAYVTVYRTNSVATARVRPGNCTGRFPFPELELAGLRHR